ncbi:hypothetical protein CDD80_374 [Ophiocordyceps camponoti-rufipedis]|uniref:GIY-YIG domain-containing protein n=1 Tax=Ophiocordyceps camponoti-rufipedis TaxID=2004952 RepID=A0A2C5ZMS3_9HYPO|nr:hypothetical protein CDD80_374 [Ophiocordyceps camponoti-rufipedis]
MKGVICRPLPALYTVYVLRSSVRKSSLYIGSTPNPRRRLKQHNGDTKGGAMRTSRHSLRPWEMVALVSGFPSMIAALKFEWALTNPHLSLHIPKESRLTVAKSPGKARRGRKRRRPRRPPHSLLSVVSNLHLLTGVPSFARWPLDLHFFAREVYAAWEKWVAKSKSKARSTKSKSKPSISRSRSRSRSPKPAPPCRAGMRIWTDFAEDAEPDEPTGVHALPIDYKPMKDYLQKARDVVGFEREGACVHCGEELESGRGLHAMCPLDGCTAMGHLDCWSRHGLAGDDEGHMLPDLLHGPAAPAGAAANISPGLGVA